MACFSLNRYTEELSLNTKLRLIQLKYRNKLIEILNVDNSWQDLASVIPDPDNNEELLFSSNDISILENQWKNGVTPAQAMFEHWSTCGKEQATIKDLLQYLEEVKLLRVVDYIKTDLLKIPKPPEDEHDSILKFTFAPEAQTKDAGITNVNGTPNNNVLENCVLNNVKAFCYSELARQTKNFLNERIERGGCKVGEGAYGSVFRALHDGNYIAVKRLNDPVDKQFFTELNVLTKFKHENLLPLLGYSNNGPFCCVVYAFMENGSLQERLACIGSIPPISWKLRMTIAQGAASGINHLHTFGEQPMIHRDIKSANILLDANFVPKVGDFGLVRIGDSNISTTIAVTKNIFGTSVYMAREAFDGDVSVKLDTFSFGVVLLELLTGLPPYDASREDQDLVTYMEDYDDIIEMLDARAGSWNVCIATRLYDIAKSCLTRRKKFRPTMTEVLKKIEEIMP